MALETAPVPHERRVAVVGRLIERDLRLLRCDVAQHAPIILLHRCDRQRRLREVGLRIVEGDLELTGIQAIQDLALVDVLVLGDVDLLDDAGDVGRDADRLGVDIGIVRRHHLAASDVPVGAGNQCERQQRKHCPADGPPVRTAAAPSRARRPESRLADPAAAVVCRGAQPALRPLPRAANPMSRRRAYHILQLSEFVRRKVLTTDLNENPMAIAYGVERNSGMDRGDLANLTAFVAVADQRSFRAAATRLGVTPSALSHSMRQLEERLGVRLLHRTTRSVSATDAGQRLLNQLRPAIDQIAGALENLNQERLRPMGRLRIYATSHLVATAVVVPIWDRFLSTYPEVHLELHVGDAPIDIVAEGYDAGLGPQDRAAADMIAVRVTGPMKIAIVGAPAYFARQRTPRTPDDLARQSCIQYRLAVGGGTLVWTLVRSGKMRRISVDGRVMVNDADLATRAAVDGLGIAYTPEALAQPFLRSGQLVRVLEDWSPSFEGFFVYYPGTGRCRQVCAPSLT